MRAASRIVSTPSLERDGWFQSGRRDESSLDAAGAARHNTPTSLLIAKKTSFGADLIEGMKLVLARQLGTVDLEQVWPKPIDVKAIRKRVKMSQAEFSRAYGISKRALQEWEQGGWQPTRPREPT